MSRRPPLTDEQVFERLHDALLALGDDLGSTVEGETALKAARQALTGLQLAMRFVIDREELAALATERPEPPSPHSH